MDILELKQQAKHSIPKICMELFPDGRNEGGCWKVGSLDGERGRSMSIFLHGEDAGKWTDFATGEHGDVIDLVQASQRVSFTAGPMSLQSFSQRLRIARHDGISDPHEQVVPADIQPQT